MPSKPNLTTETVAQTYGLCKIDIVSDTNITLIYDNVNDSSTLSAALQRAIANSNRNPRNTPCTSSVSYSPSAHRGELTLRIAPKRSGGTVFPTFNSEAVTSLKQELSVCGCGGYRLRQEFEKLALSLLPVKNGHRSP